MYLKSRRIIDIVLSLFLLTSLFWFLLSIFFIQLILLKENPIFFQVRAGKKEQLFNLYKFKTMRGEQVPNRFCLLLRISGIDELPQLFNILLGDMSFVGPRPLLPEYIPLYNQEQKVRHTILPGLTGLAQVMGGNELSWKERFDLDIQYINTVSLRMDIKILILTVLLPFKEKGGKHFSEKFTGN